MSNFELDIPMPPPYKSLLVGIVDLARVHGDYSFLFNEDGAKVFIKVSAAYEGKEFDCPGFPTDYFCALGLIERGQGNIAYVLPKAVNWHKYQNKNRVGRFLARHSVLDWVKNLALIIAFGLSVWLTYLQIMEQLTRP